jgi:hypothetical protein
MQNLSDNDLDNLFKKAAAESDPEFDPAHWNDMAQRLNTPAPIISPVIKWTGITAIVGTVVLLSLFSLQRSENENATVLSTPIVEESPTKLTEPAASSIKTAPIDSLTSLPKNPAEKSLPNNTPAKESDRVKEVEPMSIVQQQKKSSPHENLSSTNISTKGKSTTNDVKTRDPLREVNGNTEGMDTAKNLNSAEIISSQHKDTKEQLPETANLDIAKDKEKVRGTNHARETSELAAPMPESNHYIVPGDSSLPSATAPSPFNMTGEERSQDTTKYKEEVLASTPQHEALALSMSIPESSHDAVPGDASLSRSAASSPTMTAVQKRKRTSIDSTATENTKEDSIVITRKPVKTDSSTDVIDQGNPTVEKNNFFSRIALKASITPDFSSDSFQETDKTGLSYGLQLEYFLTPNVSISTGAIWSRKYYTASDVNYLFFAIEQVQGDCRMWDIPLNLSYYATPSKPYSLFISAGLSSYLMNSENYNFELTSVYDGSQEYSMQVKNGNNEWFKIMNISVGLQGRLTNYLAFQIEPFLKIPLSEIGAGNVQLASFGSYFSLRYRLPQKNN